MKRESDELYVPACDRDAGFPKCAPRKREDKDDKNDKDQGWALEKELLKARTILITGPIDDQLNASVSARLLVLQDRAKDAPISVFINSPGGSADSGFAIYDMLRFVGCPIRTIVNGICASAAILIFLGGDKESRCCTPGSRFLLHQPSTESRGTASDLSITAEEIIKIRKRYNRIVADATGRDPEDILKDVERDFWLSSEEALEYKLVDRILTSQSEI